MKERKLVRLYYAPSPVSSELNLRRETAIESPQETSGDRRRSQGGSLFLISLDRAWKMPCLSRGTQHSIQHGGVWSAKWRLLRMEHQAELTQGSQDLTKMIKPTRNDNSSGHLSSRPTQSRSTHNIILHTFPLASRCNVGRVEKGEHLKYWVMNLKLINFKTRKTEAPLMGKVRHF